jgi:hypothetical protein
LHMRSSNPINNQRLHPLPTIENGGVNPPHIDL